jgi:hypothetical protein
MGQFDVLPALATLIAIYFALRQKYLLVGIALGFGTLLKVYPVFLFVFYISLIVFLNIKNQFPWISRNGFKQVFSLVAGGALSLVAILPFILESGSFTDFILRRTDYQQFGGVSIWSFWNLFSPGTSPDTTFPSLHITTLIYVAIFAVAILWAVWVVRSGDGTEKDRKWRLIKGNVFFIASLIILQPLTNPQHLIWLLPFLLLLIPNERWNELRFMAISILGSLFLISILSFNAFLYPLATFTGIVDVSTLNQNILQYYTSHSSLYHDYVLGMAIFSTTIFLYTIFLPRKYDPLDYLSRRFLRGDPE